MTVVNYRQQLQQQLHTAEQCLQVALKKSAEHHQLAEDHSDEKSRYHCETALYYRRCANEQYHRVLTIQKLLGPTRRRG